MKIDSIIFDLDGTLWDAKDNVLKSWNKTLCHYNEVKNKLTVEDMTGVMGLVVEDVAAKLLPYLEEGKRLEIAKRCCEDECEYLEKHGGVLYGKLEETLKVLAEKYKLFIVSNCECGYIESFFRAHGLEKYFADYENPGRTGLAKGENIKLVIERNELASPIYVGDTEGDRKAARQAGVPFVYASYGFGKVSEFDETINSFDELMKLV